MPSAVGGRLCRPWHRHSVHLAIVEVFEKYSICLQNRLRSALVWEQDSRLATCQMFRVNLRFQGPQITQHFVQSIGEHVDIRGGVFESDRPRLETGT